MGTRNVPNGTLLFIIVTGKSQYLIVFRIYRKINQKSEKTMIKSTNSSLQNKDNKTKCPDCDFELNVPCDVEKGELLSCPGCGLELEVKEIKEGGECVDLQELVIEGEDWGE
jgi:transcription elongation factor Elf1